MAQTRKTKIRYVDINVNRGNFVSKLIGSEKKVDFSDVKLLRTLLSNEKARILYILKENQPSSIYGLAKLIKRDFKSVREDLMFLERFGFVELVLEKKGKRESIRPVLATDSIQIIINV